MTIRLLTIIDGLVIKMLAKSDLTTTAEVYVCVYVYVHTYVCLN